MKEHYITRCQLGYKLRSGWREIEFPTKWEAEKYAEEYRKSGRTAYVTVRGGEYKEYIDPDAVRADKVVAAYVDRFFKNFKF